MSMPSFLTFDAGYQYENDTADYAALSETSVVTGKSVDGPAVLSDVDPTNQVPSVLQKIGAIDIGQTARDLGTAIGTIKRQIGTADDEFKTARDNAASGNKLGTWWQYASTTDKIMVGLAALGVAVAVYAVLND